MTNVTRQRKPTLAAQAAALPATTEPVAAGAPAAEPRASKPALKAAKPAAAPADADGAKAKAGKPKLVRDSFTMPKGEYELLAVLKQRGTKLERHVKKSELLRAGIAALNSMSDADFLAALDRAPSLKTGRPKAADKQEEAEAASE